MNGDVNVCVGKEWYRFGSSFFLPSASVHLQFVKSGFDGLLPQVGERGWTDRQPFAPGNGTWTIPEHMNTMNEEETSRYVGAKRG